MDVREIANYLLNHCFLPAQAEELREMRDRLMLETKGLQKRMLRAFPGMRRPGMPLFCSCLELIGKTVFAVWLVPAFGYPAVCVCEPVTWVICCAVIAVAVFRIRGEFVDKIGEQKN